jgi:ribosomal protein L24E
MKTKKCHQCGEKIPFIAYGNQDYPKLNFCSGACEDLFLLNEALRINKELEK